MEKRVGTGDVKGILNKPRFGWLTLLIVAGYFVAGFWPFEFRPRNGAGWPPGGQGLRFHSYGIAYDPAPLPVGGLAGIAGASASFSLELWIEPHDEPSDRIAAILTIHNPSLPHDFLAGQWESDFLLRAMLQSPQKSRRVPESGVDNTLPRNKLRFFTIRGDATGTDFYVNGTRAGHSPGFVLNPDALNGQLIVGNSASGKQPWGGRLLGLAIYDHALPPAEISSHFALWRQGHAGQLTNSSGLRALYLFNEGHGREAHDLSGNRHHLILPAVFRPVQRKLLIPPWKDLAYHHPDYSDILANITGFLPFGFCFFLYRRSLKPGRLAGNFLLVIFSGAAVSLAIEIMQAWLPNRTSSLMDLMTNTAGTLMGALAALAIQHIFHEQESRPEVSSHSSSR